MAGTTVDEQNAVYKAIHQAIYQAGYDCSLDLVTENSSRQRKISSH
ncbi:MAG: hypothetical protein R2822_19795 [Spirosomataceae bacterium]